MSKLASQSFLVVVDTNALFSRDPAQIASEGFKAAWTECLKLGKLRLALPEIARGERLYQMCSAAKHSQESAAANLKTMARISGTEVTPLPGLAEIRKAVEKRFDEWVKTMGIEIVPVPLAKIDWRRVVDDAIWRVGSFTPPGEHKDGEKGFRDCLIVETLNALVQSAKGMQVVFITKDRLLRDATIARFQPVTFAAYENLSDLHSYLKLTHEQVEKARNEFVQKILQKAPGIFYSSDDPQCLYTKFGIGRQILQKFSAQLSLPSQPESANSDGKSEAFVPGSEEKIIIGSTEYVGGTSKHDWGWKTRVQFVRVFIPKSDGNNAADSPKENIWEKIFEIFAVNETVRIAPFDIHWTARFDEQANVSQLKLVEIKALPHSQEVGFFKFKYGFKAKEPAKSVANPV